MCSRSGCADRPRTKHQRGSVIDEPHPPAMAELARPRTGPWKAPTGQSCDRQAFTRGKRMRECGRRNPHAIPHERHTRQSGTLLFLRQALPVLHLTLRKSGGMPGASLQTLGAAVPETLLRAARNYGKFQRSGSSASRPAASGSGGGHPPPPCRTCQVPRNWPGRTPWRPPPGVRRCAERDAASIPCSLPCSFALAQNFTWPWERASDMSWSNPRKTPWGAMACSAKFPKGRSVAQRPTAQTPLLNASLSSSRRQNTLTPAQRPACAQGTEYRLKLVTARGNPNRRPAQMLLRSPSTLW